MNSLERVVLALQHKEADRVPIYPLLNSVARNVIGATYAQLAQDPEICAKAYIELTEKYELDVICTLTDLSVEASDFGAKVIYDDNEAAYPDANDRYIKEVEDYKKIQPIPVASGKRMQDHIRLCELLVAAKAKETPIVAFVFEPLGIVSMLRGQQEMFVDLIVDPDEVKAAVEAVTAFTSMSKSKECNQKPFPFYMFRMIVKTWQNAKRNMVKRDIDNFKKDGGFILSTGCEYPASQSFEKAIAIIETGKTYGKY